MLNFAQFSATMALNATIAEVLGDVDPALVGRLQSSVEDRNWDSIEALWQMKEEIKGDAELPRAFAGETAAGVLAALDGVRARAAVPRASGSIPTAPSSATRRSGRTSSSTRRGARTRRRSSRRFAATSRPTTTIPSTLAAVRDDLERREAELLDGVPGGRGARAAAGGARPVAADEPAHARPPLLHRPGHERTAAARPRRDRPASSLRRARSTTPRT